MFDDPSNADPAQPEPTTSTGWRTFTSGDLLSERSPSEAAMWELLATRLPTVAADDHGTHDADGPAEPAPVPPEPVGRVRASELAPYAGADDPRPPELVRLLHVCRDLDQLHAEKLALTQRLIGTREVVEATDLPLEEWLDIVGRMAGTDRRALIRTARDYNGFPQLSEVMAGGHLSWSQIRLAAISLRSVRAADRAEVDSILAGHATTMGDCSPDVWVRTVDDVVATFCHKAAEKAEERADRNNFVALTPRPDGSGGTMFSDLDAPGYAAVTEMFARHMDLPDGLEPSDDHETVARNAKLLGHARAEALVAIAKDSLAGNGTDARPTLLAHVELETLLGLNNRPGRLLTVLTGGELHVTGALARRLADGGCDLRLLVTQDGTTVGVGRLARLAPGWLRDAVLAMHTTCVHPGCRRPARQCDIDHADGYARGAPTDAAQLAPLCRRHHTAKTKGRTDLTPADAQGDRYWTHRQTGMTVRIPGDLRHRQPRPDPVQPPPAPPPTGPAAHPPDAATWHPPDAATWHPPDG